MAERRMMSKKVIHGDDFMDLPASSKVLYFYLMIDADDDGFVNSPKRIQRMIGSTDDDAKLLLAKKFIISFESGVIVVKHWKMHNIIRKDRHKPTTHTDELTALSTKDNDVYTLVDERLPNGSIGEVRLGEVRLGKDSQKTKKSSFEIFLKTIEDLFEANKILTHSAKINKTDKTKKYFKLLNQDNLLNVANDYTRYVTRNKGKSVRLDKYLIASYENNLDAIEYGVENNNSATQKTKQQQILDEMFQEENQNAIDAVVV